MNVSLTPELEAFVRAKVGTGTYNNASEVVREALRLLRERSSLQDPPSVKGVTEVIGSMDHELRSVGIAGLSIFGSVARGDATPDSDVDILIEVDPQAGFSLFDLAGLHDRLSRKLGRRVDVIMANSLRPEIKDSVLREAKRIF